MISVEMECFSPPGLAVRREREMPGVPPRRASRGREASPSRQLCWGDVPLTSLGPQGPPPGLAPLAPRMCPHWSLFLKEPVSPAEWNEVPGSVAQWLGTWRPRTKF